MNKKFVIDLNDLGSFDRAIKGIDQWQERLKQKTDEVCERLATLGAMEAVRLYSDAYYVGTNDTSVSVEQIDGGYMVRADGQAVLFLEFGAGIRYGDGHPENAEYGMGPGTYPGKGHWDSPHGWWTPAGEHTYGNPPRMAMYEARKTIEDEIARVVREVFAS